MSVGCVILACTLLVGASAVRRVPFSAFFFGLSVHCAVEVLHPHKSPVGLAFFFFFIAARCVSPNRLALPRSDALKGSMMRVIELNTATFEVRGYLCVCVKVCGAKKKVRVNSAP